ncbi:restriction endonuclease subunit S [Pseudaquabacterium pictum]|uniref:Restriction modification system DNA specificity domain-containing protein n=1 Tax=Pseudaquabacterium pictum TaxID=2315236 RepID=A0A480AJ26_9BURK|nr:restriction endonuclease subunit S [Rubrivivax pictus]GCL61634.1 restriction modification system DNA specificity domain-containing protein [Rubrivivax pictus]
MTAKKYARYKESGVEWLNCVPDHWTLRRLGYYFEERREKVSDADFIALSVTKSGIVPQLETAAKTDDGDNRKRVAVGDFVINSRSDRKGSSGVSDLDGSVSLINTVLIPRDELRGRFVHHLLRSTVFQEEYYRFGRGIVADLWSTNYSEMRNIQLAVPPIDEQIAISDYLDVETAKVNALVEEQRRLIELLKEKRRAVVSNCVTKGLNTTVPMKDSGVDGLGKVPSHWTIAPLGCRYSVQLGKMLDTSRITGQNLRPYLRVFDVQWGCINTEDLPRMDFSKQEREKFQLMPGDLLVNEGGSYPGRSAIWRGELVDCYYQKALHRLRANQVQHDTSEFLFYVMLWAADRGVFRAGGNEATIEHLPAEKLRRYRLPFPPINEQKSIAEFLSSVTSRFDALIEEASSAMLLLQERHSAIVSAAVTGKIDVRGLVPQPEAVAI